MTLTAADIEELYQGNPVAAVLHAQKHEGATDEERRKAEQVLPYFLPDYPVIPGEAWIRFLSANTPATARGRTVTAPSGADNKARSGPAESLRAFMGRMRQEPEPGWLVADLIPDGGVLFWHGRPRSMKSLTCEDVMLSLALGESHALGNPRFGIRAPAGVLWLGEEDSGRLTAYRFGLMLAGRGIPAGEEPESLRLVIRPGWDLETPTGQAALLATIRETAAAMRTPLVVLVIDPARASLPSIDGGPKDASRARAFLLTILRDTSVKVILLPHHDVKPAKDGKDDRSRAERASGGVTFSAGDCMIAFERVNDRECLAFPTAYKVGSDPKPFRVRFESETPAGEGFRGFVRAVAQTTDEAADTRDRVLAFVRENPWSTTSEIEKAVHVATGAASRVLAELEAAAIVQHETGPAAKARGRSPNASLWAAL